MESAPHGTVSFSIAPEYTCISHFSTFDGSCQMERKLFILDVCYLGCLLFSPEMEHYGTACGIPTFKLYLSNQEM